MVACLDTATWSQEHIVKLVGNNLFGNDCIMFLFLFFKSVQNIYTSKQIKL